MWQAEFPQGDMQHVNVCLQALCKSLRKSCREQEKEEEEGVRKWEACGVRNIANKNQQVPGLSLTDDSRERAVTAPLYLHKQHPSSSPSSFLMASGKKHSASCLEPFLNPSLFSLNSAPTGPQGPEHGDGWMSKVGGWGTGH